MNDRARPTECPSDVGSQPAFKVRRRASSSARRGGGFTQHTPYPHTTHPVPGNKLIVPGPTGARGYYSNPRSGGSTWWRV